jgi:hypothetical protein
MASRLFCGPELSEGLLNLWIELVDPSHREPIVHILADIAVQHLQLDLAEADIELLSRIDPGRADELGNVRRQLLGAAAETSAGVLGELDRASVPPQILEAIKQLGATREVIIALVAQGVRTDLIAAVVEAFPPRPAPAEGDPDQLSAGPYGSE